MDIGPQAIAVMPRASERNVVNFTVYLPSSDKSGRISHVPLRLIELDQMTVAIDTEGGSYRVTHAMLDRAMLKSLRLSLRSAPRSVAQGIRGAVAKGYRSLVPGLVP